VNRIATAGALSASIAHEVNQPLMSVVASANAALRWLSAATPDLERARTSLTQIVNAGHRASDVIKSIRAMFKKDDQSRIPVNINGVISQVLALVSIDLQRHQVTLQTEIEELLPPVIGDRVQLQQVLLNLIMNAVDAMDPVTDRPRVLHVRSKLNQPEGVLVSVEDTGTGIDPADAERIFAPLFTTKPRGMGMGLSICRSIIEAHRGKLWASPGEKNGSVFQFVLPTNGHGR
jgi:signal transduction histidine kinase